MRFVTLMLLIALVPLPETAAAWAAIPFLRTTPTVAANVAAGKHLFERHCAVCHGMEGKGGRGPGLNRVHLTHAADDEGLKLVIENGISPDMPPAHFLSDEELENLAAFVRSLSMVPFEPAPGDAVRGARIYAQAGCSKCHIVAGDGTGYAPELTDIGIRRSAAYIKEAIAKPGATMPEGFLLVEAVTPTGEKIKGIRVNEDTFSIQIKGATGRFHSLPKQNLKQLRKLWGETPMPSYEGIFDPSELDDLAAYLASLRGKQ